MITVSIVKVPEHFWSIGAVSIDFHALAYHLKLSKIKFYGKNLSDGRVMLIFREKKTYFFKNQKFQSKNRFFQVKCLLEKIDFSIDIFDF